MANESKYFILNGNFVKLRKAVGLTQEEIAAMLKIKRSSIGAYEEHRAEVTTSIIKDCVRLGYLLPNQLYEFMFSKSFKPSPTRHYKKVLIEKFLNQ